MVVQRPMIRTRELKKSFGDRLIFEHLNMEIPDGSVVGIFGDSGIGKSTLAKILCGVLKPDQGAVFLDDRLLLEAGKPYNRRLGLGIQMVYQQPYASLDPHQRIGDGLRELIRYHGFARGPAVEPLIRETLGKVSLEEGILAHRPHQISCGEAQRIAIARSLLFHPRLLILDEATSMLDVSTQANVLGLVRRVMGEGAVMLISHDRPLIDYLSDQIYVFDHKTMKKEK